MGVGRNPMLATVIRVLAQTLVHGMFISLMPIVSKVLLGQKFRAPCRTLFWLTLAAFILSTGYWALSVAFLIVMAEGTVPHYYDAAQTTFNAAILLNFLFADGVVVWRMYVLCALHFSRKILLVPILLYGMLCVSVLGTIILRIAATATHKSPSTPFTVFQACGNILSLATNLAATSIILVWAYQRHQTIKQPHNDSTHGNARLDKIVLAIVESGLVYCFFTVSPQYISRPPTEPTFHTLHTAGYARDRMRYSHTASRRHR
ncbi:hypothetical protein BC629DRAFT_592210 [Irpex lacteus]|nr:hypothetical protein BC629DRAFT_592210 [Irpex lacteus]